MKAPGDVFDSLFDAVLRLAFLVFESAVHGCVLAALVAAFVLLPLGLAGLVSLGAAVAVTPWAFLAGFAFGFLTGLPGLMPPR